MSGVLRYLHPVLPSKRLGKAPVQVKIAGDAYVLFRDQAGKPAVLVDACPHRHAPLSRGRVLSDGRIACSYHGWRFDAEGRGECPTGATLARCDTVGLRAIERHGYLWIADRDSPQTEPPPLERDGYRLAGAFSMAMPAPLAVCLDNFSENEHVPFVHTRLGWDEAGLDTVKFEAHNFDDRSEVSYRARQRWSPLLRLFTLKPGDVYNNAWTTWFDPVRTEYTIGWTTEAGASRPLLTRTTIFMVPETEKTTVFHSFITTKLTDPRYAWREWMFRLSTLVLGWWEIRDDSKFVERLADTGQSLEGMKLGKYDKPVIHNRKLLSSIYWGGMSGSLPKPRLAPAVPDAR